MIAIRDCAGWDELEACVRLQVETWGAAAEEVFPRKAFLLAQKIGGQVMGAFDTELEERVDKAGSLVGFVMSLPGMKSGENGPRAYLHSHLLAVRSEYRDQGIGAQLKWKQRVEAMERGIGLIEWTFDPLEIKNAFLNISKLGAVARRYEVDFYGVSSSRLQCGLPTDRLVAEWRLDSPGVKAIVEGRETDGHVVEDRISVPAAIYEWKARDRERAQLVQLENRRKFQEAFLRGLAVTGFALDADRNGIFELGFDGPA